MCAERTKLAVYQHWTSAADVSAPSLIPTVLCIAQWGSRTMLSKVSLNSNDNQVPIVAGTYCTGYQPHMLNNPRGLFVTINFELYVADAGNNRIQRFQPSQLNGTTVAGSNAPGTIQLCYPTAVMLDDDGYLFILDSENYRVVGSDLYGFRCLFGCTHGCWPASDRLSYHQSMVFDSHGNIFVAGGNSGRVQKFRLSFNSCGE